MAKEKNEKVLQTEEALKRLQDAAQKWCKTSEGSFTDDFLAWRKQAWGEDS